MVTKDIGNKGTVGEVALEKGTVGERNMVIRARWEMGIGKYHGGRWDIGKGHVVRWGIGKGHVVRDGSLEKGTVRVRET
jgi:hypothetical protein